MIKLQVEDFGPIVKGTVDLKPLTIFVGPNNSGKSYFAVLAYALFRSLLPMLTFPMRLPPWKLRGLHLHSQRYLPGLGGIFSAELLDDKQVLKSLQEWLKSLVGKSRSGKVSILFRDLPDNVRQVLEKLYRAL